MTKVSFYSIMLVVLFLSLPSSSSAYTGGLGTAVAPWQIANIADWQQLMATPADWDKNFILTADIDLGGQVFTTAIIAADISPSWDFQGTAFTGTFDGSGHKITNFAIDGGSNDYLGLFGKIDTGGLVKNLGLENCSVSGGSDSYHVGGLVGSNDGYGTISDCYSTAAVSGFSYAGGLVGYNLYGSISHCCSTGAVSGSGSSNAVGGLVGSNSGIISHCCSTGAVSGSDHYYISRVGGLVGSNAALISNCYSTGAVSVTGSSGSQDVGGLVGSNGGNITQCYSTGAVSGSSVSSSYVGGLVGSNYYGDIGNCYSMGTVSGSNSVGGLVGYNKDNSSSISIINCYSTSAVSGSSSVGGLVGYKEWGIISNCYSTGTVGSSSWGAGGLVGSNVGSISDCYSKGTVSGSSSVGGLVGWNQTGSIITACFWDMETSGQITSAGGTPRLTAEMKTLSIFTDAGWDFIGETDNGTQEIWRMCLDAVQYPRLTWEYVEMGDFTCPDGVNLLDLVRLAADWLSASPQPLFGADTNGDGVVNLLDFAIFAAHWLLGG